MYHISEENAALTLWVYLELHKVFRELALANFRLLELMATWVAVDVPGKWAGSARDRYNQHISQELNLVKKAGKNSGSKPISTHPSVDSG